MKRGLDDIRGNMPHVGCDNDTALEMCDEIERLHRRVEHLRGICLTAVRVLGYAGAEADEVLAQIGDAEPPP